MVLDIYAKYTLTSLPAGLMYEDLSSFSSIFYDSTLSIYQDIKQEEKKQVIVIVSVREMMRRGDEKHARADHNRQCLGRPCMNEMK